MIDLIEISLDPKDIDLGIRRLFMTKKKIQQRMDQVGHELVKRGVTIAKEKVVMMDAVYTAQLVGSIDGEYSDQTHSGYISTNGVPYAAYVEYGTGIVGANSPHPLASEGWVYDVNGHGYDGWTYWNDRDGRYHTTAGMPARPFMYETYLELETMSKTLAKEILKK